jgi:hypothetical protein
MASHSTEQIDSAIKIFCQSLEEARLNYEACEAKPETRSGFGIDLLNSLRVEHHGILQPA